MLATGIPLGHAAVSVPEGVKLFQGPLFQTSQREVFVITQPGSPARRLGRLPRGFSPLVYGGDVAWSVTTGTLPVNNVLAAVHELVLQARSGDEAGVRARLATLLSDYEPTGD
jgi:hypothetical protein